METDLLAFVAIAAGTSAMYLWAKTASSRHMSDMKQKMRKSAVSLAKSFMDSNHDGKISVAEFKKALMDCFEFRQESERSKSAPQRDFATLLQVHEKSSSGSVAEYQKYLKSKFDEIDSNHDGVISVEEMEKYLGA